MFPLILTKIVPPKRRADLLHRPRLVDFIHQHIDRKLILLCASAGYGKTSLLIDYANDTDLPVCWYSLDPSDRDPRLFLEYLVAALQRQFPQFGQAIRSQLQNRDIDARQITSLAGTLVNTIYETIPDYFVLVLDDYHLVDESEPINAFLDLFLRYLPENCHIILSSRSLPSLPLLRLAAYREVVGIGTADLRFTADEIQHLLKQNYNLYLSKQEAQALAQESEGWITGIILATHTFWHGVLCELGKARESQQPIFEYLATEVFAWQPPPIQRFLLQSSVLDRMNATLCDQLLGTNDASETLALIEERNLFITRFEDQEIWYTYHHLFREFLRTRLRLEDEREFARLHLRAAQLFQAQGQVDEAIAHFLQAQAYEQALEIIKCVATPRFESGHVHTLARWIDALPADLLDLAPHLLITRAKVHVVAGEPGKARQALDRAAVAFTQANDREGLASVLVQQATTAAFEGQHQAALRLAREALALAGEQIPSVAAVAHRIIGLSSWRLGHLPQAITELEIALNMFDDLGNLYYVANVHQALGSCYRDMGDRPKSQAHFAQAMPIWQHLGSPGSLASLLNDLAVGHYHAGEYEQAAQVLDEALTRAREAGHRWVEAYILASLGDVYRDWGDHEKALSEYQQALEVARQVNNGSLVGYVLDGMGTTHRLEGRYTEALALVSQAYKEGKRRQSDYELGLYETSLGIIHYEQGQLDAALEYLSSARQRLEQKGAPRELARACFHLAQVCYLKGQPEEALAHLQHSLTLSAQVGYEQFIMVDGRRSPSLLRYALSKGIGGSHLSQILNRIEHSPDRAGRKTAVVVEQASRPRLQIYAFGQGRVIRNGQPIAASEWTAAQARELFFYLLSYPHRSKEQVGAVFWSDLSPGRMNSVFHATLYRLRRAVGQEWIVYQEDRYHFNRQLDYWYDVEEFERLLAQAEAHPAGSEQACACREQACALFQGDYLEDIYADWSAGKREELHRRYLEALAWLADFYASRGRFEEAIRRYLEILARDNLREDIHRRLMKCYVLHGERGRALKHYHNLVALLKDELGIAPMVETTRLAEQILAGMPLTAA